MMTERNGHRVCESQKSVTWHARSATSRKESRNTGTKTNQAISAKQSAFAGMVSSAYTIRTDDSLWSRAMYPLGPMKHHRGAIKHAFLDPVQPWMKLFARCMSILASLLSPSTRLDLHATRANQACAPRSAMRLRV